MATPKPPPPSSSFGIPDLDVPSPRRVAGAASGERSRGSTVSTDFGTTDLLDDELDEAGPQFTLDLVEERMPQAAHGALADRLSEVTPLSNSPEADPENVSRHCSWGDAPKGLWKTVPYATAVVLGRRELSEKIRLLAHRLEEAEHQRDSHLAKLGEVLLERSANEPRLQAATDAAREALANCSKLEKRRDEIAQGTDAELNALQGALGNEQLQLQSIESQLRRCRNEFEQSEVNLRRAQARLQRLNIERRNLEQSQLPEAKLTAGLDSLKQQEASIAPTISEARRALAVSSETLKRVLANAEASRAHVRELERLQLVHRSSRSQELQDASALALKAEAQKRGVLADLARASLAGNKQLVLDPRTLDELRSHDDEVAKLSLEHQVLLRAFDNFDRSSMKQGLTLIAAAFAIFVSGIAWIIMK